MKELVEVIAKALVDNPDEDVVNSNWKWKKASLSNASVFSALGYYFAKELSRTVDVPIGVVMAAAGGAVLHELMPADVATECGLTSAPSVPVCGFYNSLLHPFRVTFWEQGLLKFAGQLQFLIDPVTAADLAISHDQIVDHQYL